MTKRFPTITTLRYAAINGLIAVFILLMVLQGMPLNMPAATVHARLTADWLGIGSGAWDMYAPVPDRQNHRLSAELMSSESHVVARWSSPEWRKQSAYQRFWGHRWAEYYDNVWGNNNAALWPALAQHVADQHAVNSALGKVQDDEPLRQVKLIAETKGLAPPAGERWPKPVPPEGYDDNWVLSIEPLPF
ncbi:hypothetical protein ETAA8_42610 [Anatilimnocola aggregata]|uniref:Uncharacterized protein n=1 Tax=Anatilimnocola aggregata TaxID=2528021 RepID=A0A517YG06_9BACT|nr:hypothetical protein [Anatilimnocola aggregata]QDU29154.1 hypothetical protein ETAA8_42610 [Anatilimnocola aggregata]